jgi:hypothetical protein
MWFHKDALDTFVGEQKGHGCMLSVDRHQNTATAVGYHGTFVKLRKRTHRLSTHVTWLALKVSVDWFDKRDPGHNAVKAWAALACGPGNRQGCDANYDLIIHPELPPNWCTNKSRKVGMHPWSS